MGCFHDKHNVGPFDQVGRYWLVGIGVDACGGMERVECGGLGADATESGSAGAGTGWVDGGVLHAQVAARKETKTTRLLLKSRCPYGKGGNAREREDCVKDGQSDKEKRDEPTRLTARGRSNLAKNGVGNGCLELGGHADRSIL